MSVSTVHIPVLLKEVLHFLDPQPNRHYIDATVNGGGMAASVLAKISPNGHLLAIDQDPEAIERSRLVLREYGNRAHFVRDNFKNINKIKYDFFNDYSVAGIYFDLGISSDQLEDRKRGISFQDPAAPLDMRLAGIESGGFTAAQVLNHSDRSDLVALFKNYGEEPRAEQLAKVISERRKIKPFMTVGDLLAAVFTVYKSKFYLRHPGTKIWQALRIVVNDELGNIKEALPQVWNILAPGGRLVVVSFHSLEDRIIKQQFKSWQQAGSGSLLVKKVVTPTREEIKSNPRCRSGKLRAIEKL